MLHRISLYGISSKFANCSSQNLAKRKNMILDFCRRYRVQRHGLKLMHELIYKLISLILSGILYVFKLPVNNTYVIP
jgi:hypothetical protein